MLKTIKSYSEINSWQSTALKYLEEMEYRISKTEHKDIYQSPNRSNGLRFYYDKTGFEAESRNTAAGWNIGIRLESYGREKKNIYKGGKMISNGSGLTISGKDINIEYKNDISGMRQNFVVKDRVGETGYFTLVFNVSGNADYKVVNDKVLFTKESLRIMDYKDLVVYDSNGRELHAEFNKSEGGFEIRVNDMDAVYPITIDPISVSPEWIGESNQTNAFYGISVASAGDVNGDGYSDMIIGADCFDDGETDEGKIFVYFGSAEGLPLTADWTGQCNQSNAGFGTSVSTAGDVNGDGYSDVIVGAYYYTCDYIEEGAAFLYLGSATGLSSDPDWIGKSHQQYARYGRCVSTAGDVNGDGYSDVIIGSASYDDGEGNEGAVFAYYGSEDGLSESPNWMGESNQEYAYYGRSVSTAGDVNGDGFSDIIVGALYYDNGETDEGAAFVYYGSSAGLSTISGWMGEENQSEANYGIAVNTAGDVNGDGYSDVIVGAPFYENGQADEGCVFVYYGSLTGLSYTNVKTIESNIIDSRFGESISIAGDVNGDGYSDVIIGAVGYDDGEIDEGAAFICYGSDLGLLLNQTPIFEANQEYAYSSCSVNTAGDVNGDGYSDVIIGAYGYENGQVGEGGAFLLYGSANRLSLTPNFIKESNQQGSWFGYSVSNAGDVNGDGFSDIIVGALYYDNGETDEGAAFIYYGSKSGISSTPDWMGESNKEGAFFGRGVSTAGDVNGDGYSDVIVGAYYYTCDYIEEGAAFLYLGSELDYLQILIGLGNRISSMQDMAGA